MDFQANTLDAIAPDTDSGPTIAQDSLAQRLRELGIPDSSPMATRVAWARTAADWVALGSSNELDRRFVGQIERALTTVLDRLRKSGAIYDALLVALDLGLLYLEHRRFLKGGRGGSVTEPDSRWADLRDLTLTAYDSVEEVQV